MSAIVYNILLRQILGNYNKDFELIVIVGMDYKDKISIFMYALGIVLSFVNTYLKIQAYITVAIMWFIPERKIEKFTHVLP